MPPLQRVKQVSLTPPTPGKVQTPVRTSATRLYSEVSLLNKSEMLWLLLTSSQVVANRKENLSSENNINIESGGHISPRPPGRGRNGVVTRAANADKHPGFLALDEEDLKARKKKDYAALRRRARAEEKKSDQARLEANVDRIAAFEDVLSIQHAATLENAARPATRARQVKAAHSLPVEPVSVESAQSEIRADHDSIQGAHNQEIVESDASRADDLDYVESESEGPLTVRRCVAFCTLSLLMRDQDADGKDENVTSVGPKKYSRKKAPKQRKARVNIEAHCNVESRTHDKSNANDTTTNIGKHKHSDSYM